MRAGAYAWPGHATKQVAFVGPNLHVHELWVARGGDWSQADLTARATGISGGGRGAPPGADSRDLVAYGWPDGGTKQVAYVGDDRHVYELFVGGSASDWMWGDLTTLTGCPPVRRQTESLTVGMAWSGGHTKQVAYVGDDGHIH